MVACIATGPHTTWLKKARSCACLQKLREELTQSQEESSTLKSRLEHSETQAQKFQVENRSLRARLESAADTGATDSERLAEVQVENSELMGAVMEARAATSQAEARTESEKVAADRLRAERQTVDAVLEAARYGSTVCGSKLPGNVGRVDRVCCDCCRADAEKQKDQVSQLSEELEALSEVRWRSTDA
jgi:chromosome segregation ATPase